MRPQTFLTTETQQIQSSTASGWATMFIAAPALRGDHTVAHLVRSLAEHDTIFGGRASYSELRDQLETFFSEGGKRAYVARVVDESADVAATITILDAVPATLATITAKSVGEYANGWTMVTTAVSGTNAASTATWTLSDADGVLEQIVGKTVTEACAHEWADIDMTIGAGTGTIVAATRTLASGTDGQAGIATADYEAALLRFTLELGTGIVVAPMLDATAGCAILEAHADAFNRVWLSHSTDTSSASTIAAQGTAARSAGYDHGGILSAKVKIPALATDPTSLRTIAPEGAVAGRMALTDELGSPARAAAGTVNGTFRSVVSATQSFSDADLDTLHNAGINVIRLVRGELCLYDYITPAPQSGAGSEWLGLGTRRAHAAVLAALDEIAELYQFSLIDGANTVLSDFHSSISAALMGFHEGNTLYGASPADAFSVNVSGVNTDETIADNELHAAVAVRYSETNIWTYIEVTKVPLTGTV